MVKTEIKQINTENPKEHWEFIDCYNKIVLDLGCGRWEHVEYRDPSWPTTPEYLIQKGASKVYALDSDPNEYQWFKSTFKDNGKIIPLLGKISSTEDAIEIIKKYKPDTIKMDIEGFEEAFLNVPDEQFSTVNFYAIETHSDDLYNKFIEKFNKCEYEITAILELTHAYNMKVIFCKKT